MKKGVVQTKFWKRGLAATLAAAMLCGNFLEVGSSLKVFAEDGVASNAGVTVNIDTDFSTLTLENVPSNVDIPLNIQVDEAELTAKTENLEEEQKSAAQNAYQAEMQAGFEQKLNELLEGKSVVDYTGAQDAPNIGVVTAVSFDEDGSVDDISFIGVNTGAESREITVSLTHPIEVDKAASGLQTVELDAQLNLDAFKEEEAPDNGDQSESETETPDNGDQSESETETPDNGDQSESETETPDNGDQSESETETPDNGDQSGSETETPDNGDQSESETETPDNGDQSESETETPDNGDQSEGDESNSKNQELTPDSTPAGVTNQSASYSELTDHFSVGTNDDLSNLEDPDKETTPPTDTETPEGTTPPTGTETPEETTPPEEPENSDDMPKNYWNISANPKVNEGTISFTEAISPAANFAVEEASDTALISALSFMVPGESIAQATPKKGDSPVTITKWVVDEDGHEVENNTPFIFYLSGDKVSEDTRYTVNGEERYVKEDDDDNLYITLKNGETAKFSSYVVDDDFTVTEKETDDYEICFEYDKEEYKPDLDEANHSGNKAELNKYHKHVTFYNVSGGSSGGSGEIKPPEVIREPKVSALKEIGDAGRSEAGIYPITLTVDGVSGNDIITEEMPLNVLLVWDASSSMGSFKWESLTTASSNIAQVVLGEENTQNQMAIDVYSHTAAHLQGWTKNFDTISDLCDKSREIICDKASIAKNGTNCEQGAVIAGLTLDSLPKDSNAVNVVVYLSDGEPYQYGNPAQNDKSEAEKQAKKAIQELQERTDSTLYTVGIGNFNSTVLGAAGNGYFLGNHEANKLTEIFQEIVKITRNIPVVNYNVSVTDPMSKHVNITKADGKVITGEGYSITDAASRADWLNKNKASLGLTFTYQGYQKNDDGTLKLDEQGKPIKDAANTASASSSGIDGNFPDITTYEQLLEQVTFSASGASDAIVQLIWTPGDHEQLLDGEYTLTYTVNVKADQDNFENNNNYPANGTTVVSGQYKSGDTITPANPKELAPVQVYQEQNTLTIQKTGTNGTALSGAEFVVSFTDDAGNTKYLTESGTYVTDKSIAEHFITGNDGTVTIDGLYDYIYTVEEVKAPSGYSPLANTFTVDFTGKEGKTARGTVKQDGTVDGSLNTDNSTGEVTVQNAPSTGSITVNKVLKDANDQLIQSTNNPAFKVKLTKDNDPNFIAQTEELTWINNTYNTVTFNNLEAGTYTITEYLADDTLASSKYDVTVTASGSPVTNGQVALNGGQTVDVTITNTEKANGSITVTKELKGYNGGTPSSTDKTFYVALYKGDATTPVTDATVTKNGSTVTNNNGVYEIKANETLTFSKLPYGTYTVKEVTEDGDELGSDFDYTVTDSGTPVTLNVNNTTDNVIITNTEKADGRIEVTKKLLTSDGTELNDTSRTFYVALYQGDEIFTGGTVSSSTGTSGVYTIHDGETLTFSGLPYGTYTVKEVVQKDGQWTPVDDTFDYTVTDSGTPVTLNVNNTTGNVTITNKEKANGSITVTKELKGYNNSTPQNTDVTFHFGLYQNEQPVKDSNGNDYIIPISIKAPSYTGTAIFSDLPYGTYTVKEVVEKGGQWTPVGNDFDYTVTDSGTPVTLNVGNKTGSVQFTNTEKNNGQISVTKTVTEPTGNVTPAPLNGDEVFYVALYQGDGTTPVTDAIVTNGEELATVIADGIYEIKDGETLTFSNLPYGNYTVKEVTEDGTPVVDTDPNFGFNVSYNPITANTDGIVVRNSQEENKVTITNTRKVEGSIVLKKVIKVASNDPDDDKTFTFQITGDGIDPISVTVEPDSATGALKEVDLLQVLKKAGVTEIYGKEFTITEKPHDYYTLKKIISEDNPNTSTGLKGFLEALLAPRNADPFCTFTPERDTSITITATNTAKTGSIEINKVDNVGNALPGVTFGLFTDKAATTPFEQDSAPVTATTGNDGTATFSNVPVGTYYLKETAVPAGYVASGVIFEVTVTSNGTTTVTEDTKVVSDTQPEFTDNKLINTPDTIKPTITITKAAATGDEAFIKADSKEYTVQITGNESSEAVTLNNAKSWTGTISDFALMPNVKYTVSETVPEGAHWALDDITITFKDGSGNTVDVTVDENHAFTLTPEQASQVTSIEIVVTNKAKRSEAHLKVTEQVIGNLLEAEKNTFNFTVKGPDGTFTGLVTVKDGNVTEVSGWDAGNVEVAELPKLIPGETYTITQADHSFYTLNSVTGSGMDGINGEVNDKTFKFTVPADAEGTYTVAFTNYANTIPVTLAKVLEDDARPLNPDDQFDFDITTIQDDGHAFTTAAAVTTTNSATFNLIKGKTYTIKEVAIPDGYQLVSIAMNEKVLPSTEDVNPSYSFTIPIDADKIKLVATNRILGSYDFIKMGKVTTITQRPNGTVISRTETTNPLAGATFTLKDEDGVLLQTVESAADGKVSFNNLPAGEYIIEEASAPSGFNKWNYQINLTLSIDGDRDMIINAEPTDDRGTEVKDYMLCIYNYREDIITEQDPPIPPTDPEDPGDPRPSGGGDETTTRTIEDTPTPTTTIEDEDVPLAPLPNDMITIDDEDVPLGDLPYTGGLPFELVGVLGIALVGAGLVLRKKNKKD